MTSVERAAPVAVVTGGARRLGRHLSMALAARGYEIFDKRQEDCRKIILVPGAQSAEVAKERVTGLVNPMPGGVI